jgi:hypothetical protein
MKTKFLTGQEVSWTPAPMVRPQRCTVVRVMPIENASRTYRIKGATESCERSVPEESLSEIRTSERDRVFRD